MIEKIKAVIFTWDKPEPLEMLRDSENPGTLYPTRCLTKKGTIDQRAHGERVARWEGQSWRTGVYRVGRYATYIPEREVQAEAVRQRIAAIRESLETALDELHSIYAGPKPESTEPKP